MKELFSQSTQHPLIRRSHIQLKVLENRKDYDSNGEYNNILGRFTAVESGYYHVSTGLYMAILASGKMSQIITYKNGTEFKKDMKISTSGWIINSFSCDIYLNANDYLEIWSWHNHGSTSNISAINRRSFLDIHRFN